MSNISTKTQADILSRLALELHLQKDNSGTYFGVYQGYPIAVTYLEYAEDIGLLFQIRHPLSRESLPYKSSYQWSNPLNDLIRQEKAKIEVEDGLAWFTLYGMEETGNSDHIIQLLHSLLGSLKEAGVSDIGNLCHYCRRNEVASVSFLEGRVAQICNVCLSDRLSACTGQRYASTTGVSSSVMFGGIAAIIGAVLWGGMWIVHDWFIGLLSSGRDVIYVPELLAILIFVTIGFATGWPIGYAISRIPDRGDRIAGTVGAVCGLAAVLFGEIICVVFIVYRLAEVVSFSIAKDLLWVYWSNVGFSYLVHKVIAAFIAIMVAYLWAKPRKTSLNL